MSTNRLTFRNILLLMVWLLVGYIMLTYALQLGTFLFAQLGERYMITMSAFFGFLVIAGTLTAAKQFGLLKGLPLLLMSLILLGFISTATAGINAEKGEGFSGGVNWSASVDQNLGYASVPGAEWVDVWHRGHYPLGGFTNYRLHLRVDWKTGHHGYLTFDSRPTARAFVTNERFVDYNIGDLNDSTYLTTRLYGCSVEGHWRSHGCFFAKIKVKMTVKAPTPGVNDYTIYPWAAVRVNSAGAVVWWDSSSSIM